MSSEFILELPMNLSLLKELMNMTTVPSYVATYDGTMMMVVVQSTAIEIALVLSQFTDILGKPVTKVLPTHTKISYSY